MANLVLRSQAQRRVLRWLILLLPIFSFGTLSYIVDAFFRFVLNLPSQQDISVALGLWLVSLPTFFFLVLSKVYSDRIVIKNGILSHGFLGKEKLALSALTEIAGYEGSLADNYKESLILVFENGRGISVDLQDYSDEDIRSFLSTLKAAKPDVKCTYSDIIPLESRGLLKFLVSTAPVDSLIVELSKTPLEDTIVQLIKRNEKKFLSAYATLCFVLMFCLSFYNFEYNRQSSNDITAFIQTGTTRTAGKTQEADYLQKELLAMQRNPSANQLDILRLQAQIVAEAAIDYFSTGGLQIVTLIWYGIGLAALGIPFLRLASPNFVFIDSKSFGMGRRFLLADKIRSINLRKASPTADPLEGTLVLTDDIYLGLTIELSKISELQQRHLLLRLVERYAPQAKFNDEFLRTTNALVDIQFTDLWLQSMNSESSESQSAGIVGCTLANGKYEVRSILGYGGQGTTYLATPVQANEHDGNESMELVIKESVLPNQADVRIMLESMDRFEQGANLLSSLQHPQIVKWVDHFVENGKAYLVLEYVSGKTLRQLIKERGPMPVSEVAELGKQLCDILEYLHSLVPPVIHCDLAPDNLILMPTGKLKLVDFDVARVMSSEDQTLIAGRPSYTPPEQFRGKPTVQSDIYAFGGILHYLLSSKDPPPLGDGIDLSEVGEDGSALVALVTRCLEFEALDRPSCIQEVRSSFQMQEQEEKISSISAEYHKQT